MKNNNKGFTLIELMVVIAIVAILTAVILSSIYGSRGKARDAKRISDIAQIQLALEQYFDRCQVYPSTLATTANCTTVTLGSFISAIPTAPSPGSYVYSAKGDKLDYVLKATLESHNDAINDGLRSDGSGVIYTISCPQTYDQSTVDYCVGPK